MKDILRFVLVLFLVNLVAASILAGVYIVTKPRIEQQKKLLQEEALREIMPEEIGDRLEPVKEDGEIKYWKVFKGPGYRLRGYVFIAKKYGYSSVIETMVGIKRDGTITGVKILSQNETPGLGAKIVEVVTDKTITSALKGIFSKKKQASNHSSTATDSGTGPAEKSLSPYFTEQLKGLDVRKVDIGNIDAITGATISSKAVVDSMRSEGLEILNAK